MGCIPGVRCSIDATVAQISVSDGGHLLCLVVHTAVTLVIALVGVRETGTNLHDSVDLVVDVGTAGIAVVLIALHQTLVVHSRQRDVEVGLLVTALNRHLVVL